MSLLVSPIDGSPMRQIHRHGIEIDVCPTTGGVWLDKGELEKLIALIKEEAANDLPPQYEARPQARHKRHDYDDDRYDDDDYRRHGYKKSKMSKLLDIFD